MKTTCGHCGQVRGLLPGGILICDLCDKAEGRPIPNEHRIARPGSRQ